MAEQSDTFNSNSDKQSPPYKCDVRIATWQNSGHCNLNYSSNMNWQAWQSFR